MGTDINEIIKDVTEKIQKNARAKAVFGAPVEKGNITVIPVARISICGGGGGGQDDEEKKCNSGGMGMGVHAKAIPVGYIEISPDGTSFKEIIEKKRVIFAGIIVGGFAFYTFTRFIRKLFGK